MFRSLAAEPTMGKTSFPFEDIVGLLGAQVNDLHVESGLTPNGENESCPVPTRPNKYWGANQFTFLFRVAEV